MLTSNPPLEYQMQGQALRLMPQVDLVASTVEAQRAAIMKAMERRPGTVVLDLGEVEQLDSLGITLILGLFKSCRKDGVPFAIEEARADLMRVFRLFNLPKFFPIAEC
jgi:anti-anti-sigma factor